MNATENSSNQDDTENGFGYSHLEHDQVEPDDSRKRRYYISFNCIPERIRAECFWGNNLFLNYKSKSIVFMSIIFNLVSVIVIVCLATHTSSVTSSSIQDNKGDIANSSNAFMGNCSSINPCDVGNGICRSDVECGHGLKCGKRNCPVMIEDEVEVVANCCYKPNDDPCKEFELVSIGGVKAMYASKLGTYIKQDKKINENISYRKTDEGIFLYRMNSTKSAKPYWIFGSHEGVGRGWMVNYYCTDVDYPANGRCSNWWQYWNGTSFQVDSSMRLLCKDISAEFDLSATHGNLLPPKEYNAIVLTIEQPLFELHENNFTPVVQYNHSYVAKLDTGNSLAYPTMRIALYNQLKTLNIIKKDQKLVDFKQKVIAINTDEYMVKTLILEDPLVFMTEIGTKIKIRKFFVQDHMSEDINIGKYFMSELGIRWDLKNNFVNIGSDRVPLRSYTQ